MDNIKIGDKFGHLTILEFLGKDDNYNKLVRCKCDCGNECTTILNSLITGHTKSCGCARHRVVNHSGEVYGKVTVLDEYKKVGRETHWNCRCGYCENEFYTAVRFLKNGSTKSCGCLNQKIRRESIYDRMGFVNGTSLAGISPNRKLNKNSSTGVRGVTYIPSKGKYRAQIMFKRKTYSLGYYNTVEEAARARKEAETIYYDPIINKEKES